MSLLLLFNPTNGDLLQQFAQKICVQMWYIIYLTENGRFYVEIEENEVYVVQYSPETESRKYRFFVFNGVYVATIQSNNPNNGIFIQLCAKNRCVDLWYCISLTENGRFYVEIEENEVYVVQASPEIQNRKYIFFLFNDVYVDYIQYEQW